MLRRLSFKVGRHCRTCGAEEGIEDVGWACGVCGATLIHLKSSSLSEEQTQKLTMDRVFCRACRGFALLRDLFECRHCRRSRTRGERATLFDVDLTVTQAHSGESSMTKRGLRILDVTGPKPLRPCGDPAFVERLDLARIFKPTAPQVQLKLFGSPPTGASTQKRAELASASEGREFSPILGKNHDSSQK